MSNTIYLDELYHHGILGQRWGIRRYQNADGSLTRAGKKHIQQIEKKDVKWANKNYDKITSKAYKQSQKELSQYDRMLQANMMRGKSYINAHNKKMAELMNTKVSDLSAPSGRAVKFVAKRGEMGVHMALADRNYDMSKLKNGVWNDGRVAYKKNSVNVSSYVSHHGVKGMHWGIRKTDSTVAKSATRVKMNLQFFAKKASSRKTVKLSVQEHAHVMSELRTNITAEEKTHPIVRKAIGDFIYSFENHFDDTYRVIRKKRIPDTATGLLERINDGK